MEDELDQLKVSTLELKESLDIMQGLNHGLEMRVDLLEEQVASSKGHVEYYSSKVKQLQVLCVLMMLSASVCVAVSVCGRQTEGLARQEYTQYIYRNTTARFNHIHDKLMATEILLNDKTDKLQQLIQRLDQLEDGKLPSFHGDLGQLRNQFNQRQFFSALLIFLIVIFFHRRQVTAMNKITSKMAANDHQHHQHQRKNAVAARKTVI